MTKIFSSHKKKINKKKKKKCKLYKIFTIVLIFFMYKT